MDIIITIVGCSGSPGRIHSILHFVLAEEKDDFSEPSMLVIETGSTVDTEADSMSFVAFMKIASVNLYFLRSFFTGTTLLNGLPVISRKVYTFAQGSSVHTPPSIPIYYSDITARFASDKDIHRLSFVAENLTYFFPDGLPAITDVSFSAAEAT
jgi:hypothetical protein